jgi:putative hydrolases of HD superfamily
MNAKRDIEFLFEMGQLRLIKRMWKRFFQSDIANVADHAFRVTWIALAIAKREKNANEEKIIKMALLHDICESRTGDVDYIARQYVERKDNLAMEDMFKNTVFEEEFGKLWEEYEARQTIEAKIVKDADMLDVDFELKEQSIQPASHKFFKDRRKVIKPRLFTKTARAYWELIQKSDPHDWHTKGRNRFLSGDWKNK